MDEKRNGAEQKDLNKLSKEELILKVKSLFTQNQQLKNVIAKRERKTIIRPNSKPFNFEKCTFRHVLIKFLYLGWNYNGYTVQEDTSETIEDYLFEALTKTCLIESRSNSNYHRCGRTDKGVSSFSQVISIDVRSKLATQDQHKLEEEIDYCSVLNRVLPDNIQCIAWSPVAGGFSARFDCKGRTYKYFFPKGRLDIDKMQTSSKFLLGTHDFRNFCKMDVGNGVTQFIRCVTRIELNKFDGTNNSNCIDEYTMYVFTISGQAFLWHQVRNIIGILFLIGEGKEKPEIIKELLDVDNNPRKPNYNMASEIPLNLYDSLYESNSINWQYRDDVLKKVVEKLNRTYTINAIQSAMIRAMIDDLKHSIKDSCPAASSQFLLQGVKSKVYVPVMKREKCESLEQKIEHFAKRKKNTS